MADARQAAVGAGSAGGGRATNDPAAILHEVFGYGEFRGQQEEIVRHVVAGGDALVLMPTGGGKSLCYQIPALCRDGVAVVVSPLIALMQDQVEALRQQGVRAAALNSSLPLDEVRRIERALAQNELDLLYVAPERLLANGFLDRLALCRLALFAIDEAHCVSQWGHDFRPDYLNLAVLHERFPDVPRIALTATADGPTRRDIVTRLKLEEGRVFVAGFDRPNIRYRVIPKQTPRAQLLAFLGNAHRGDSGIVYCRSRARVDETALFLAGKGFTALPYHAGLDGEIRARHLDRFLKEEGIVVVATIAFGMGINKPDVRFVAHLDLPKSLEAYYQETGRAGRDGLPSDAWMTYGLDDIATLSGLLARSDLPDKQRQVERQKFEALLGYCETTVCRRRVLLGYFGESREQPCGNCDVCQNPAQTVDGTELAQKLLSCIYRTGQRFGAGHVIDVLIGHDTERTRQLGHDKLSTWGIGKATSRERWRSILRQLAATRLVVIDVEGHGALRVGEDCRDVLRGERRVELRIDAAGKESRSATKAKRPGGQSLDEAATMLFEALRALRRNLAREQGVPPYVIFHDATLEAIATAAPQTLPELARLPGVGAAKLERYGVLFLDVLREQR